MKRHRNHRIMPLWSLILLAVACTSSPILPGGMPASSPYACGTLSQGHCYAELFVDPGHLRGFRTQILVSSVLAPGDGFVDNEFWLTPYNGTGWLEGGYQYHPVYGLIYFWAEVRQDGLFIDHIIDSDPQDVGYYLTVDIHETSADNFSIALTGKATSYSYAYPSFPLFGPAPNSGGYVAMGQELAGTGGAQAGFALFLFSQGYDLNGTRQFITGGSETVDKPPYGGWLVAPSPGNGGGAWSTWCCAP